MADKKTVSISKEHIKFRYSEPYTSEASNMQMGINDAGPYKGADLVASGGQSVTITAEGGECLVLHRDPSDGIATVVRVPSSVVVDLSSALSWPLAGDTTLYFFMTVDYQINAETTGSWKASDSIGDIPSGAVRLGTAELLSGATGINQSDIRVDGTHRDKVHKKTYMRVPLRVGNVPSVPIERFQLTGKIYYMGTSAITPQGEKIELRGGTGGFDEPMMGSDGGKILAGEWYAAASGGSPLGVSDMDDDGCYTDPWIAFDFSDTADTDVSDSFNSIFWACIEIDSINSYNRDFGRYAVPHAYGTFAKDVSGTPDSLTKGRLSSQLSGLLGFVNDRIKSIHPDSITGTPVLLWRSNNVTLDASVDNDTISIYFNSRGIFVCHGCYMPNNISVMVSNTGDVRVFWYHEEDGVYSMHREFSSGEVPVSVSITGPADWDEYINDDMTDVSYTGSYRHHTYSERASVEMNGTPNTGDNGLYVEMLDTCGGRVRAYWGGSSSLDYGHFVLTFGCYWHDGDSRWKPVTGYGRDWAWALDLSDDGFEIRRQSTLDLDGLGGWGANTWTTSWAFHEDEDSPKIIGDSEEQHLSMFKVQKLDCHIRRMIDPAWVGPTVITCVPFPMKRGSAPDTVSISQLTGGTITSVSSSTVGDLSWYGIQIQAQFDVRDLAQEVTPAEFLSTPTRIKVTGIGHNFAIGQWVAIRSATGSNEGAWSIADIVYSTDTFIELHVDGDGPASPSGTITDELLYFINKDDDGDELFERVRVTVSDA